MTKRASERLVIPAAGGVVWRDGRVAVVRRSRYDDRSLPKGKLEPGESFEAAAVREVEEETGAVARIDGFLRTIDYPVGERRKLVVYFGMEAVGSGRPLGGDEIAEVLWLEPDEALAVLSYPLEQDVLRAALAGRSTGG